MELREAGLMTTEQDQPHLILLPGDPPLYQCSECGVPFFLKQGETSTVLADRFIKQVRVGLGSKHEFPIGVRIALPDR